MTRSTRKLVLLDHDRAIDDFLATMLIMTMEHCQTLGVIVTPADCYIQAALNVTRKILDLMGQTHILVVESRVRGINSFPSIFRRDCLVVDRFPILNEREKIEAPPLTQGGTNFMVEALRAAFQPITLAITGPLTTLATALNRAPDIKPEN